jgi:hypothetical protein
MRSLHHRSAMRLNITAQTSERSFFKLLFKFGDGAGGLGGRVSRRAQRIQVQRARGRGLAAPGGGNPARLCSTPSVLPPLTILVSFKITEKTVSILERVYGGLF